MKRKSTKPAREVRVGCKGQRIQLDVVALSDVHLIFKIPDTYTKGKYLSALSFELVSKLNGSIYVKK